MNRQTLLRIIVAAVAAIIAVLLIVGIIMAITRTGVFADKDTTDGRSPSGSTQSQDDSSESTLPGDTNNRSTQTGTGSSAGNTPTATTGSIPSTGSSDATSIALVSLAIFGATYATALRFTRR